MIYTNILHFYERILWLSLHFYERLLRLSITIRQLRDRTIPTRNNQIVPDHLKVVKLSQGYSKGIAKLYAEEEAFPLPRTKQVGVGQREKKRKHFCSYCHLPILLVPTTP